MSDPGIEDKSLDAYKPLSCSLYDVLESAALLKTPLLLVTRNAQMQVLIKDVFAKGQEEFLRAVETETGSEHTLRLDVIRQIIVPATKQSYSSEQC
ncbi:MAG: hypothetical protein WEB33_09380 [Bacteroidota bacterium]